MDCVFTNLQIFFISKQKYSLLYTLFILVIRLKIRVVLQLCFEFIPPVVKCFNGHLPRRIYETSQIIVSMSDNLICHRCCIVRQTRGSGCRAGSSGFICRHQRCAVGYFRLLDQLLCLWCGLNGNTNVDSSFVTKSIGPPSFISMSISSTVFEPLLVLLFNL